MADETSPSRRKLLALEVIESYRSWDIEKIMAYRADNCVHEIAPSTLFVPLSCCLSYDHHTDRHPVESLQQEPKGNEDYRKYWTSIAPLFTNFQPTVHDIIEDQRENKLIVWASSTGQTVLGPYANEYMLLLYFNPAGDKVERFVEFVDSDVARSTFSKLYKLMEDKQQQQQARIS